MYDFTQTNSLQKETSDPAEEINVEQRGVINKVRGSVIDVRFSGPLPEIENMLTVLSPDSFH